jgi:hypothetical protein
MGAPFAKLRILGGASTAGPGAVIGSVPDLVPPNRQNASEKYYVPLPEAAAIVGILEADLRLFVRTRRVRSLKGRGHCYFRIADLRTDLELLTTQVTRAGGGKSTALRRETGGQMVA